MLSAALDPTVVSKPAPYHWVTPAKMHGASAVLVDVTSAPTTPPPLICAATA